MHKSFINILYLHIQNRHPYTSNLIFICSNLFACLFLFFIIYFFFERDIQSLLQEILNQFTRYFLTQFPPNLIPTLPSSHTICSLLLGCGKRCISLYRLRGYKNYNKAQKVHKRTKSCIRGGYLA